MSVLLSFSSSNSVSGFKILILLLGSEVFTLEKYFRNQRYTASWTDDCLAEIKTYENFRMASLVFKFWFLTSFTACLSVSEVLHSDFEK